MRQILKLLIPPFQLSFLQALIGPVIGGLFGAAAADDANDANAEQARLNREFNFQEAERTRMFNANEAAISRGWQADQYKSAQDFAERMSSTAYQRAIGDMESAGLNPMLAYSQGSASAPQLGSPSGATASAAAASHHGLPNMANRGAAAMSMAFSAQQLENLRKQEDNIDADTELKKAAAVREISSAGKQDMEKERIITGEIPKLREEIKQVQSDIINKSAQHPLIEAQTLLTKTQQMVEAGKLDVQEVDIALKKVEILLKKLSVPEAQAYAEKFKGEFGKDVSPYVREAVDILRTLIYSRPSR